MGHEPIQFTRAPGNHGTPGSPGHADTPVAPASSGGSGAGDVRPRHLELKRDEALIIHWADGQVSTYPIPYLRRLSPSAEAKALREEMKRNPLTVLPSNPAGGDSGGAGRSGGALMAEGAELVGNYAIRIRFSDGHDTGIYSWAYLREIDPAAGAR